MSFSRKEIVLSSIRHEETALCPYTFAWEHNCNIPERLDSYYGTDEWRRKFRNYIVRCGDLDDGRHVCEQGQTYRTDYFGSVWRTDLRPMHLEEPVLKEPTLKGYKFPDPELFFPTDWEKSARRTIAENGDCFLVVYGGFGLFERSWALRGFAESLMDCVAEPEFFGDLIAAIAEHYEKLLDRLLEFHIDGILFGDDWGDQRSVIMGPERWREFLKPHYARLYAKAKAAGKFVLTHCCGAVAEIIPDAIEIGLDVLESVQPEAYGMNPYELKNRFGDRLTFWGGLGSQSIIPYGNPKDLREEIRRLAAQMSKSGGYILAGSKSLQPDTPTKNVAAILEEFIALGEKDEK